MIRRTLVEYIVAWLLIITGATMVLLPIFHITDVKSVFTIVIALYGVIHLIKYFTTYSSKDTSGINTALASVAVLIMMMFIDIKESPWNLALILFIWIILMTLTKIKESDYYQNRHNSLWKLNVINLFLFILTGLIASINLYYSEDIQILVLGFFFLVNGILDLMDPLVAYIIEKK